MISARFRYLVPLLATLLAQGCQRESEGFALPGGDAESGKRVFVEIRCNDCHSVSDIEYSESEVPVEYMGKQTVGKIHVKLGGGHTNVPASDIKGRRSESNRRFQHPVDAPPQDALMRPGHTDVALERGPAREDLLISGHHMGVGAQHGQRRSGVLRPLLLRPDACPG